MTEKPKQEDADDHENFEAMTEPYAAPNLETRAGYNEDFLGLCVPLPKVTNTSVVSRLTDGSHVLDYEHFSIVMHKNRRLAIVAASNVDGSKAGKRPDPDRPSSDYTRKGLSGLGKNDKEKWFNDTRIPATHQLPDVFYTKDDCAFDKGHIVRRDDVAWGKTYQELQRANGDTYHVTNCSPQVKGYNRSMEDGIWGELENLVLKQAKAETYCVFSGPVLDDLQDKECHGVDDQGDTVAQIPSHFWKVVVARNGDQLESFAFLMEQDLEEVELEFAVEPSWVDKMIAIPELEKLIQYIEFPDAIRESDQAATESGKSIQAEANLELFT